MPVYRHLCKSCHKGYEEYTTVEKRNESICPSCGSIDTPIQIGKFNRGHVFKPGFYEHLDTDPVYVSNRQQMKDECKKRGVRALCLE